MHIAGTIYVLVYWYKTDERMNNYMMQCISSRAVETKLGIAIDYSYVALYILYMVAIGPNACAVLIQSFSKFSWWN